MQRVAYESVTMIVRMVKIINQKVLEPWYDDRKCSLTLATGACELKQHLPAFEASTCLSL